MPGDPTALRVAIIARGCYPWHGFGGLERHVFHLVKHLLERDITVTLITRTIPPQVDARAISTFDRIANHARFKVIEVPYRTFPFAGRRGTTVIDRSTAYLLFGLRAGRVAAKLARMGAIDVAHGLGASALGYAVAKARRQTTISLVFNPQGLEEFGALGRQPAQLKLIGYAPLRAAVRFCAASAERVIATDVSLEATVLKHLSVTRDRLRTIPNAIDLDECDRLTAAGPPESSFAAAVEPPSAPLLLSVGRVEQNKGFDVLARALASGRYGTEGFRWTVVGDGSYRSQLKRLVDQLGLRSAVRFTGTIDDHDLHRWYEQATVFVHPTLYEGSSLVTLEAMAHRLPVIATRAGGLPDKVFPNVNGWLVEPGDVAGLRQALERALTTSPTHLKMMGCQGRTIVERSFAWPLIAERWIKLYEELKK